MDIGERNPAIKDMLKNPLKWELRCPKCSSSCNVKYLLGLAPIMELDVLPHFYCPSHRFVRMEPRPLKSTFHLLSLRLWRVLPRIVGGLRKKAVA